MKKLLISLALVLGFSLSYFAKSALADDEIRSMGLNVYAKGFNQNQWVDNSFSSNNIIFSPNSQFQIRVVINNWGNRNQTNIHVTSVVPSNITLNMPDFTVNQIVPGQEFTQTLTATVKDKAYVNAALTASTIKFHMTTDVGTIGDDQMTFYTGNGTKSASSSTSSGLPATGSAVYLILGSIIASLTGIGALKLRSYARGY